jgi:hypothetical protein
VRHKGFPAKGKRADRGEGFSSGRALARSVRFVYCHACGSVSTNVIGEHDICTVCGAHAERMGSSRPWQYYASSAMLLAAAAFFVWGPIQDTVLRALLFFVVLVASYAVSSWGMKQARQKVLNEVARRKAAEEHS